MSSCAVCSLYIIKSAFPDLGLNGMDVMIYILKLCRQQFGHKLPIRISHQVSKKLMYVSVLLNNGSIGFHFQGSYEE